MTCKQVQTLLSGYLDAVLTPEEDAALRAHLAQCPACRARLEEMEMLDAEIAELGEDPPTSIAEGVMTAIYAEKKKRRFAFGPGTLIGAAAAALVLLAAYGKLPFPGRTTNDFAASTADTAMATEETVEEAPMIPETFFSVPVATDENTNDDLEAIVEEDADEALDVGGNDQQVELAEGATVHPQKTNGMTDNASPNAVAEEEEMDMPEAEAAELQYAMYIVIYNYSDSMPISLLETLDYTERDGNRIYEVRVEEAKLILEEAAGTHELEVTEADDGNSSDRAEIVVMP